MASAAAVFDTLRTTLEKDAEKAEDLVRTFKGTAIFVIKSDDGVRRYYLDLRDSASVELDAESGREAASDIMLTMGEATLMKLVKGSLSPQMAFMAGKLKLRGEVSLAMKLQKVFALLRPAAKM